MKFYLSCHHHKLQCFSSLLWILMLVSAGSCHVLCVSRAWRRLRPHQQSGRHSRRWRRSSWSPPSWFSQWTESVILGPRINILRWLWHGQEMVNSVCHMRHEHQRRHMITPTFQSLDTCIITDSFSEIWIKLGRKGLVRHQQESRKKMLLYFWSKGNLLWNKCFYFVEEGQFTIVIHHI